MRRSTRKEDRRPGWLVAALAALLLCLVQHGPAQAQLSVTDAPPPGTCLGGTCMTRRTPVVLLPPPELPGSCNVARAAAFAGIAASAASIGGSLAIGLDDDEARRRVTSGVYAGATFLMAPLVALGGFSARKSCKVTGHPPSRVLGWVGYGGALSTALVAFAQTLRDQPPGLALSIGIGGIGAFALLPHSFDSFMGWRQARGPALRVQLGPVSRLTLTF